MTEDRDQPNAPTAARLFTVRVWTEAVAGGVEHRGTVRDATTGAYRMFREWRGLTGFLDEQLETDLQPTPGPR